MRALSNHDASSISDAVQAAARARAEGRIPAFSGGGTDLLQQVKDGTDPANVIINLRSVDEAREIEEGAGGISIGGLATLAQVMDAAAVRTRLPALAQAAESVGTPQIRNVATVAGNMTQRPWCWYYRNGFNCFKSGGNECFSVNGENGQHAIFGGGPSFIVHPSDVAPALVAFEAVFQLAGPDGEREVPAAEFFVLPRVDPVNENVLGESEMLARILVPSPAENTVSSYHKVMDRAAWTHAEIGVATVIQRDGNAVADARVVLSGVAPIPWRLRAVEEFLAGRQITAEVAQEAGEMSIGDAQPLAKNRHKLPMTSAAVERSIIALAAG